MIEKQQSEYAGAVLITAGIRVKINKELWFLDFREINKMYQLNSTPVSMRMLKTTKKTRDQKWKVKQLILIDQLFLVLC